MYRGNGLNDFGDEFSQFKGVMAPVDAAAEEAALRGVALRRAEGVAGEARAR